MTNLYDIGDELKVVNATEHRKEYNGIFCANERLTEENNALKNMLIMAQQDIIDLQNEKIECLEDDLMEFDCCCEGK